MKKYQIVKVFGSPTPKWEYLYHFDFYRLNLPQNTQKELENLGWYEIISNPKNLVFIEWPGNILEALPEKYLKIDISHEKEGRKFVFSY